MKKLVWGVVGAGLLLWSALAWVIYSLLGWAGSFASSNADVLTPHPETVEWVSWLAMFGSDVGGWIVAAIWGFGVVFALIFGFAGTRLFPQLSQFAGNLKVQQ